MPPDVPQLTHLEIVAAEKRLILEATPFPDDYRAWLATNNGAEKWFGDVYLILYSVDTVVAVTEAAEVAHRLPGFVAIGSDGSRELFAFDFRRNPPPVVMVDVVAEGWRDGLLQAESFTQFMAQRERHEPLVWDRPHS